MTRVSLSAPIDPSDRFAAQLKALQQQVAELQRRSGQRAAPLAWGKVGYAEVTANQGSITTVTDITGLSVTWDFVSGRAYKVTAAVQAQSTVADDAVRMEITTTGGTVSTFAQQVARVSATSVTLLRSVVLTGLSGSITRKVRLQRFSGSGTVTMVAAATVPAFLLVEDIGLA